MRMHGHARDVLGYQFCQVLQVLRAPNIGGHRNLFYKKAMVPFGSHQAPLYRGSRQFGMRATQRATTGPSVAGPPRVLDSGPLDDKIESG